MFGKTEISWILINSLTQKYVFSTHPYGDNYNLWESYFGIDYLAVILSVICWIDNNLEFKVFGYLEHV